MIRLDIRIKPVRFIHFPMCLLNYPLCTFNSVIIGVNIEIERTFNGPLHSKTFDNTSMSGRSSLFSKRSSVFEDYRGNENNIQEFRICTVVYI